MTQFGRVPMQYLTPLENARLKLYLEQNDVQDWLLWCLAEELFLRVSEVLSLRAGDVLSDGRVVCHRKKGSETNVLPLRDPKVKAIVVEYAKRKAHKGDPLFTRSRRTLDWRLKEAGRRCGVPEEKCHMHSAKHTACQVALQQTDNNILAVQKLAGHASVDSTLRYTQFTVEQALAMRKDNAR
jgi:integrase